MSLVLVMVGVATCSLDASLFLWSTTSLSHHFCWGGSRREEHCSCPKWPAYELGTFLGTGALRWSGAATTHMGIGKGRL